MNKPARAVVLVMLTILGTMETVFYTKMLWGWWEERRGKRGENGKGREGEGEVGVRG